jgi:hypothetical protein
VYGDVGEEELGAVSDSDRRLFGVGPGRGPATLRLMSTEDCAALLELSASGGAPSTAREPRWHAVNFPGGEGLLAARSSPRPRPAALVRQGGIYGTLRRPSA